MCYFPPSISSREDEESLKSLEGGHIYRRSPRPIMVRGDAFCHWEGTLMPLNRNLRPSTPRIAPAMGSGTRPPIEVG